MKEIKINLIKINNSNIYRRNSTFTDYKSITLTCQNKINLINPHGFKKSIKLFKKGFSEYLF